MSKNHIKLKDSLQTELIVESTKLEYFSPDNPALLSKRWPKVVFSWSIIPVSKEQTKISKRITTILKNDQK